MCTTNGGATLRSLGNRGSTLDGRRRRSEAELFKPLLYISIYRANYDSCKRSVSTYVVLMVKMKWGAREKTSAHGILEV